MIAFADASAAVKLYADEDDAAVVREMQGLVVAGLTRVEVPAALWRKQRIGDLTVEQAAVLVEDFEADWFGTRSEPPRFVALTTTAGILDDAARLCSVHGLRAYDAVQLASALAAREAVPACSAIAVFDRSLRTAASREGLTVIPD